MFDFTEFFAGYLEDAPIGSIIIPMNSDGEWILVGQADDVRIGVLLSGDRFEGVKADGNRDWKGIIVPDIRILVDFGHAHDPLFGIGRVGAMERDGIGLGIVAKDRSHRFLVRLQNLHANGAQGQSVGFSRWDVVVGAGSNTRKLASVELGNNEPVTHSF